MELFVINRYVGEDEAQQDKPDERELKEKLLKKIKKRKRLQETSRNDDNNDIEHSHSSVQNDINKNDVDAASEIPKPPKKKKKKKKSSSVTEENQQQDKETATEEPKFLILGKDQHQKNEKVKRVLPFWLSNPSVVSVDLKNLDATVDSIPNLDPIFIEKLKQSGITHFFPVQVQVIPWLLSTLNRPSLYWPNDVCISAPTGSGKTLAFVLPIVQALYKRIVPKVRAVVVLPVQDLALQVFKVFENFCSLTKLKVILLTNTRVFQEEQKLLIKPNEMGDYNSLVDIIVTTPGRLVDHLKLTRGFSLQHLSYLVIDEADKVMEHVQNDWLYHLNKHISQDCSPGNLVPALTLHNLANHKKPPQKLLFSATLSQDPEKLQMLGLFQPKLFTSVVASEGGASCREGEFVGKFTTPAELKEFFLVAEKNLKPLMLYSLLKTKCFRNVLCFVNKIENTSRLSALLKILSNGKMRVREISSQLPRKRRETILNNFASGKIDLLVSSDALARGMDVPGVQYVISYDTPNRVKTYVHRIGRTGRAGKDGTSVTFLTPSEVKDFNHMIEIAGKEKVEEMIIPKEDLEDYSEAYNKALLSLKKKLLNKSIKKNNLKVSNT